MSNETERLLKEFQEYVKDKEFKGEEDAKKEVAEFLKNFNLKQKSDNKTSPMSADDYLDLAYEAETPEDCIKFAKKALKIDKNCIDAKLLIIQNEETAETAKKQLEDLIKGETKRLEKEGYFDKENIGLFYGILETRPYMRIRASYIDLLIEMSKYTKAVLECEDLIRLSENDNMGIRDKLMTLYAMLENLDGAKALLKKYKEDSFSMLYPMAILYYRLDDYSNARACLKKIVNKNKDYSDYVTDKLSINDEDIRNILDKGMYRPDSIEEVLYTFKNNAVMLEAMDVFNEWAAEECSKI